MMIREGKSNISDLQDYHAAPVVLPVYPGSPLPIHVIGIVPRENFSIRMQIPEAISPGKCLHQSLQGG